MISVISRFWTGTIAWNNVRDKRRLWCTYIILITKHNIWMLFSKQETIISSNEERRKKRWINFSLFIDAKKDFCLKNWEVDETKRGASRGHSHFAADTAENLFEWLRIANVMIFVFSCFTLRLNSRMTARANEPSQSFSAFFSLKLLLYFWRFK